MKKQSKKNTVQPNNKRKNQDYIYVNDYIEAKNDKKSQNLASDYLLQNMIQQLQEYTKNDIVNNLIIEQEQNFEGNNEYQIDLYQQQLEQEEQKNDQEFIKEQKLSKLKLLIEDKFEFQNRTRTNIKKINLAINPQKILRFNGSYLLRNFMVVNEDYIFNPLQVESQKVQEIKINDYKIVQYKTSSLEEELEIHANIHRYKYIDYIVHENKNSKQNSKPEFLNAMLQEYDNYQMDNQYIINRLRSFCNQRAKQLADIMQKLENLYQYQTKQYQKKIQERASFQQISFLQKNSNMVAKLFQKYQNIPAKIGTFRQFQNNKIVDLQCMSFNMPLLKLIEYETYDFEYDALKNLEIPPFFYVGNTQIYMRIYEKVTKFFVDKQPVQEKMIYPKKAVYLKTKNGKILDDLVVEFQIFYEGEDIYLITLYHQNM